MKRIVAILMLISGIAYAEYIEISEDPASYNSANDARYLKRDGTNTPTADFIWTTDLWLPEVSANTATLSVINSDVVRSTHVIATDVSSSTVTGNTGYFNTVSANTSTTLDTLVVNDGTITRSDGKVQTVELNSGRVASLNRNGNGKVSTITDGTVTWTYTRDSLGRVTGWSS